MADWSELPNDVLEYLTSFLSQPDYYRFGAVCRNWCSVARQKRHSPRQLPWLVLEEDDVTHKRKFFSLEENKTYFMDIPELRGQRFVGSSYGWLFTLDVKLNFHLLNPFTRKRYNLPQLPPYDKHDDITTYVREGYINMQKYLVFKAILDRDPNRSSEFKVLIVYGAHNNLAFWKLGDPTWTLIPSAPIWVTDVIFFKEEFYAIGCSGYYHRIYLINTGPDPTVKRVGPQVEDLDTFAYLMDFMGELFIVQTRREFVEMKFQITKKIFIYKIDLDEKEEYFMFKSLEGYSVFMGANSSCITVDFGKYPRCRKNALYLTDRPHNIFEEYGCKDLWVYDIGECSFSRYYDTPNHYIPDSPPIWLSPNPW